MVGSCGLRFHQTKDMVLKTLKTMTFKLSTTAQVKILKQFAKT